MKLILIRSCPGTDSEDRGKGTACQGCPNQTVCASTPKGPDPGIINSFFGNYDSNCFIDIGEIVERMSTVKHKLLILSGKGGVGKSTVSAQLSFALAQLDKQVVTMKVLNYPRLV